MKTQKNYSVDFVYEYLIQNEYFTDEELDLVTNVAGYNMETLNDCLYCKYGYRDFQQLLEDENLKGK